MRLNTFLLLLALGSLPASAETGRDMWLRYAALDEPSARQFRNSLPAVIYSSDSSEIETTARQEIVRGVQGMLGRRLRIASGLPPENAILLGRLSEVRKMLPAWHPRFATLGPDAYWLTTAQVVGKRFTVVTASTDRGILYGAFALLSRIARGDSISNNLDETQSPYAPVRWVNQWDNLDGTIERGYGGRSIFWDAGRARSDLSRVSEYGRLLASVGINGCSINNVNANPLILSPSLLADAARIAAEFRRWGVRTALAVDFGSPKTIGRLDTFDPLDPRVVQWWNAKVDEIYRAIPDLAGLIVKADSEGRVGPSAYGRTHADAANVVARALQPYQGILFYRGFVYDHHMDWRNPKNDRARAASDNFVPLDGTFDANVIVQIKNGPIDFQVREPPSPLIGALEKTNQAIELQITQEYFGQARHTVFLVPLWKDTLDFDLKAASAPTPVKALAAGKVFNRPLGGFVGVANVGLDDNWVRNHLSQANLYGYGRLAWNPDLRARQIVEEWTRLTFGNRPDVLKTVTNIQLSSWRTYENYTGPHGLQTLTDIVGNHYGVAVEASERNGWGQWHRADEAGVGMDRTVATGTGFIGQFRPPVAQTFSALETCPDDLLLFMHHVPYTHRLRSGKTVIQSIYDSHYLGARAVDDYVRDWRSLRGAMDDARFEAILAQLQYQAGQAEVWRDAVVNWFFRASQIADDRGRAGNHPGRHEAESFALDGYAPVDVVPWEAASGGKAIECRTQKCSATLKFSGPPGWYDIRIRYFDWNTGASKFRVFVANQLVAEWTADETLPTRKLDASSSMLRILSGIALRTGDDIRIEGLPHGLEAAALDYVEIRPAHD